MQEGRGMCLLKREVLPPTVVCYQAKYRDFMFVQSCWTAWQNIQPNLGLYLYGYFSLLHLD